MHMITHWNKRAKRKACATQRTACSADMAGWKLATDDLDDVDCCACLQAAIRRYDRAILRVKVVGASVCGVLLLAILVALVARS